MCVIPCFVTIYAQGEIDTQSKVFYRNEWSLAAMLSSNGWGFNYRYGKRLDAFNKRLFEVDFAYMKHPKETKTYSNTWPPSSTKFVYAKTNLAFDFRFAYGKQHEIFRKHDVGGIAIRYFYNFGPSVVFLKPIYYDIGDGVVLPEGGTGINPRSEPERFDATWQNVYILDRASFIKGMNELSVVPGAFAKFGFNFEYSKQDRIIHALETGIILEGFVKKLEIMDFSNPPPASTTVAKNQQFFFTLFVCYRFGRIVDPYEIKKKRERSQEISY